MKIIGGGAARGAAAALFLAATFPGGAWALALNDHANLGVTQDFLAYSNTVTGSDPANSFLTPGNHFAENLSLMYNATASSGVAAGTQWEGALDGRWTDDARIDAHRFDLNRFYFKGDGANHSGVIGDFMSSFSQYSLNKSLKGARYTYRPSAVSELTVLAGIDKPTWVDLWQHNATETVDRKVYGARAAARFGEDGSLGGSLVWTDDSRAADNTTAVLSAQRLVSTDWSLPTFHRLHLYGESAYSRTNNDNPNAPLTRLEGQAHLVKADFSYRRYKTQNTFERVSPNFATTEGAATPDLIRFETLNQWTIRGPWKFIVLNYSWFHNNLNHADGGATSTTRAPETGLRYDGPDWRPTFSVELKLRDREVTTSNNGVRSRTRSVITDWNDRFGPVGVTVDYQYQKEDASDGTNDAGHHIVGVGANYMRSFTTGWSTSESLNWNLQRDRNNLIATTDQTGGITANASVTSPWGADARASFARNLVLNMQNPSADRRSALVLVGYNILKRPEHRLEVDFKRNDNRLASGQDFRETVYEAHLIDRF